MGFALTLVYIAIVIISPGQFGQVFADSHPMVYLAGLTTVASLPALFASLKAGLTVQTQLAVAFLATIVLSQLHNGVMAANASLFTTLPSAAVFFFIVINVTTLRRVDIMVGVVIATCFGLTVESLCGYYGGSRSDMFVLLEYGIRRLRATGIFNDPNDFAQFLLMVLPLIFVGWNRGRIALNCLVVLPSAVFILWAVYLTHSRGALVAVGVLLLAACYKRIGAVPSATLAGLLVFGLLALNFTGGRGISAADGSDRLELWAEGLQYFKRAPLFGIGFGEFADPDFSGMTAHNSFILCLAELGILGSTVFVGMLATAFMGLNKIINSPQESLASSPVRDAVEREEEVTYNELYPGGGDVKAGTGSDIVAAQCPSPEADSGSAEQDVSAVKPYAVALRFTLISFIATSYFLSRSYTPAMFLMVGLTSAVVALEPKAKKFGELRRQVLVTCVIEVLAIAVIYGVVRLRS